MFINAPVEPEYYFKDGLPCDFNFETPFRNPEYTDENQYGIDVTNFCDVAVLNSHFYRKEVVRKAWKKWYGPHLWGKPILLSILMAGRRKFENFTLLHIEQPFLKSVFKEVWEKEETVLRNSCSRFRQVTDLNQYLMRYWQFASNKFYPVKKKGLMYYYYNKDILEDLSKVILEERVQSLCINDTPNCSEDDFILASKMIQNAFEIKFPNKSIYEK
jgi:hypothetical protein